MFRYMLLAATIAVSAGANVESAEAQTFRKCAVEDGLCKLPYPTDVTYGAGHRSVTLFFDQPSVRCSNRVFGDPQRGVLKSCSYEVRPELERIGKRSLRKCATENGICRLPYPTEVVYGAGRKSTSRHLRGPAVRCSNETFGDPARGVGKSCSYVVKPQYEHWR